MWSTNRGPDLSCDSGTALSICEEDNWIYAALYTEVGRATSQIVGVVDADDGHRECEVGKWHCRIVHTGVRRCPLSKLGLFEESEYG